MCCIADDSSIEHMFESESTSFSAAGGPAARGSAARGSAAGGPAVGSSAVETLTNHVRSLTDDGLVDQSRRIASAIAAAEAELAAVLAEVERRGLHGSWDCPSVERFASWHCQLAPSRAAAITSVGRALSELPVVAAAVVSGQLPLAKSAPIIAIAAPDTEAALVELATHATVSQTRRICASWRRAERVEAEAAAARSGDDAQNHNSNYPYSDDPSLRPRVIVIRDHDGVELRARFDHINGELVLASLDAAAALVRSERAEAASVAAPVAGGATAQFRPASVDDIGRVRLTHDQWRAEGLLRICESSAAARPTGIQRSGFTAQVVVHVPVSTLVDPTMLRHPDSPISGGQSLVSEPATERQPPTGPTTDLQFPTEPSTDARAQGDRSEGMPTPTSPSTDTQSPSGPITRMQASSDDILEPSGAHILRTAARWLACDADLLTVLDTDAGDPLHLGRRTSTITPQQRRAVHARFRTCAWPGCASTFVQVHHRHHRAFGGHDDIENLVAECHYHHALIHRRNITVTIDPDGTIHHRRPDGSEVGHGPPPDASPPVQAGDGLTTLEHRQSAAGVDPSDPMRMPQWRGDPFQLAECIDAIFARREAALRRTRPT